MIRSQPRLPSGSFSDAPEKPKIVTKTVEKRHKTLTKAQHLDIMESESNKEIITMNEQIRNLCHLTAQKLHEELANAAEEARDAGTEEEHNEALDKIEAIIYTLSNCAIAVAE